MGGLSPVCVGPRCVALACSCPSLRPPRQDTNLIDLLGEAEISATLELFPELSEELGLPPAPPHVAQQYAATLARVGARPRRADMAHAAPQPQQLGVGLRGPSALGLHAHAPGGRVLHPPGAVAPPATGALPGDYRAIDLRMQQVQQPLPPANMVDAGRTITTGHGPWQPYARPRPPGRG